ncbi:MAG: hypothetical protein H6604_07215 [Flavobacteriales bacterium]|nr:hypothetical protein [Flavobacteriales bacterium]
MKNKNILLVLLLIAGSYLHGQIRTYSSYDFLGDSWLRLQSLQNTDATKFLTTDANGQLILAPIEQVDMSNAWNVLGNAGTNENTNFIGTTDVEGLTIRTSNEPRIRVTETGDIGLGNMNPAAKLDVVGTNTEFNTRHTLFRNSNSNSRLLDIRNNGDIGIGRDAINGIKLAVSVPNNSITNRALFIYNPDNLRLLDIRNNGSIGVGRDAIGNSMLSVQSPNNSANDHSLVMINNLNQTLMNVRNNGATGIGRAAAGNSMLSVQSPNNSANDHSLVMINNLNQTLMNVRNNGATGIGRAAVGNSMLSVQSPNNSANDHSLLLTNNVNQTLINVRNNGNVGIGTNNPQTQLHTTAGVRFQGLTPSNNTTVVTINGNGDLATRDFSEILDNSTANSWNILGNAGTNENTNFIGTTDIEGLTIRTSNEPRIRVTETGNVGLGNMNPAAKLDVVGTNTEFNTRHTLFRNLNSNSRLLDIRNNGSIGIGRDAIGSTRLSILSADSSFYNNALLINNSNNQSLMHIANSGNIGLGRNAIGSTRLSILSADSSFYNNALLINNSNNQSLIHITNSGNIGLGRNATGNTRLSILNPSTNLRDNTLLISNFNNQTLVNIRNNGNVGIGTGNPSSLLHVYGGQDATLKIHSSEAFGSSRLEFWSDPEDSPNLWRPGSIRSGDNGDFTGRLDFITNGKGFDSRTSEIITASLVNGKVGIGTAFPEVQLHTTGFVRFEGLPPSTTNTEVLTTDSNGNIETRDISDLLNSTGSSDAWNLTGNADATINNFLGPTTVGVPLRFNTSGVERMRIDGNGNIGIGVTNFTSKVDIRTGWPNTDTRNALALFNGNLNRLFMVNNNGNIGIGVNPGTSKLDIRTGWPNTDTRNALALFNGNLNRLFMVNNNGNIGIGVDPGTSKLDIRTGWPNTDTRNALALFNGNLNRLFMVNNNGNIGIGVDPNANIRFWLRDNVNSNTQSSFQIFNDALTPVNEDAVFNVLRNGNIGINILRPGLPTAKLHTRGTVRFQDLGTSNTNTNILTTDIDGNVTTRNFTDLINQQASNNWSLTGNAGTDPNTNFIGTTDETALTLRSGANGIRLWPDGSLVVTRNPFGLRNPITNAGITLIDESGAGLSDLRLQVNSNGANNAGANMFYKSRGTTVLPTNVLRNDVLGYQIFQGFTGNPGVNKEGYSTGGAIVAAVDGNVTSTSLPTRLDFRTITEGDRFTSSKLMIKNNGNIGIGIEEPQAQLHTTRDVRFEGLTPTTEPVNVMVTHANGDVRTFPFNELLTAGTVEADKDWLRYDNTHADGIIPITDNGDVTDVIYTKGYVGIGNFDSPLTEEDFQIEETNLETNQTITRNYNLFVKNGIKTERVKVEIANINGWADYVFDEDYKLMPLDKLDSYIKENKHLPNIPTSSQVIKEGIELGEMNAKLLEKIEELTLHTIDLNKKNEELSEKNKKLESTLELLLERVSNLEKESTNK